MTGSDIEARESGYVQLRVGGDTEDGGVELRELGESGVEGEDPWEARREGGEGKEGTSVSFAKKRERREDRTHSVGQTKLESAGR